MQATIEQHRQREYQRYEAYECFAYERRLTDEITDMSERLAAPMQNTFEYEMGADGELWFQGELMSRVFDDGIKVAEELTLANPQFMTELIRRRLERQEYDEMRKLALGSEGDPDVLVVLSPIPDAVLNGTQLNAYDKERKKTLVRIFRRTDTGIEATSLSLDRSDRDGLNAIAEQFGQSIDPAADSEDILAMRLWGYRDEAHAGSARTIRKTYDEKLAEKFGGRWYAGRQSSLVTDAKLFIEAQVDLVNQHMEELKMLRIVYSGKELDEKLETARYNLAAALTRRMRGDADAGSLSEAGDDARANGERYDGDCPTGVANMTAEQSASQLGLGNEKHLRCVTCPICGTKGVDGIVSGGTITCSGKGCKVDRKTGAILRGPNGVRKAMSKDTSDIAEKKPPRQRRGTGLGSHTEERVISTVGGADTIVFDRRSGTAIAKKTSSGYASL